MTGTIGKIVRLSRYCLTFRDWLPTSVSFRHRNIRIQWITTPCMTVWIRSYEKSSSTCINMRTHGSTVRFKFVAWQCLTPKLTFPHSYPHYLSPTNRPRTMTPSCLAKSYHTAKIQCHFARRAFQLPHRTRTRNQSHFDACFINHPVHSPDWALVAPINV
jgi:hypothetical protein